MASSSNKRIAVNTGLLYARMAVVMVVNLYTVRLVLNALGAVDYGIYDVVAGIVVMLQSVSTVLSVSTQRYYSYALGESDFYKISQVFSASINVFTIFSLIVLLLSETVGLWFLNTYLDIPDSRMTAANIIYQFSIFSFIALIMQTPFSAAVIANEDMGYFSLISILECMLRLLTAFFIAHSLGDRLVYYGLFLMVITLLSLAIYIIITFNNYHYFKYSLKKATIWRELLVFSGWTLVGSTSGVLMTQVCTILVNIFFGPIVNAARAIAFQMFNALNSFCNSFLMAVRPPMVKAYAEHRFEYLNQLFIYSTKFIFYTLLVLFIPLYLEMDYVLRIWLKTTDLQAVLFSRLMLIYALLLSLSNPITFIMHAGGFVKHYHISVEIPTLAIMPITYFLFEVGYPAYTTYIVMIICITCSHVIRLLCMKKFYPYYEIKNYVRLFVVPAVIITLISFALAERLHSLVKYEILRLVCISVQTFMVTFSLTYFVGLNNEERKMVKQGLSFLKRRLFLK